MEHHTTFRFLMLRAVLLSWPSRVEAKEAATTIPITSAGKDSDIAICFLLHDVTPYRELGKCISMSHSLLFYLFQACALLWYHPIGQGSRSHQKYAHQLPNLLQGYIHPRTTFQLPMHLPFARM